MRFGHTEGTRLDGRTRRAQRLTATMRFGPELGLTFGTTLGSSAQRLTATMRFGLSADRQGSTLQ